jgi:hypothetical protein
VDDWQPQQVVYKGSLYFCPNKKKVKGDIDNYNDNDNDKKNDPGAKNMLCLWLEASKDS